MPGRWCFKNDSLLLLLLLGLLARISRLACIQSFEQETFGGRMSYNYQPRSSFGGSPRSRVSGLGV